ncbi:MAG: Fic family protein [Methanimicrococcus sp.]|nr:Fic family protein [Methanimicrococcus sp.]
MEITDKKYFMKYNDSTGRKLRGLTNSFLEKNKNLSEEEEEEIFQDLSWHLWETERKTPLKETGEDEVVRGILAYRLMFQKELNEQNFHEVMYYLSEILKGPNKKTAAVSYRRVQVAIFNECGRRIYKPPEPEYVKALMISFFQQIQSLIQEEMSLPEIFYHASLIHLKLFWIHPFVKNNIKAAILIEKWFLAEKLEKTYIRLPSEKYYFENKKRYDINTLLGSTYAGIDDGRVLPFLLMLPESLKTED